jgi:hypothetical protein
MPAPNRPPAGPAQEPTQPQTPPATPPGRVEPQDGPAVDPQPDPTEPRESRRYSDVVARLSVREQELADARTRVDAMLTRQAESLAGQTLAQGADVWLDGVTLSAVLNDQGELDEVKLKAAVDALVAKRPGLKRTMTPGPLPGGYGRQTAPLSAGRPATLGDVLAKRGIITPARPE